MKLLHTSDWHVGKTIRGESRAAEHRAVLDEITGVIEREAVDLVIVAGDLFDTATTSPESDEIVYAALVAFARAGAEVAVIGGNHDNQRRLRAVAPLLEFGKVHLVAEPTRPELGGVLHLTTRDGTDVRVAMLPFVSKRGIVRAADLMEGAAFEHAQAYSDRLRILLEHLCGGFHTDTVNVLAAHAFVLGATAGGGERAAHLVDEYAITAQSFPSTIGYGALGHLHRAQHVPSGAPMHYCGSPLQLDFGESDATKQVNLVHIEPGLPADVQAVPLTSGWPLRTIRGPLASILDTEVGDHCWLRVIVDGPNRAGLAQLVRETLGPGVVDVRVEQGASDRASPAVDHRTRSPQELFDAYLAAERIADTRVRDLFATLLDEQLAGQLEGAEP